MGNVVSEITFGIRVNVKTFYLPHASSPLKKHYTFAYQVEIINESEEAVQLLSREWTITDSWGNVQRVKGDGVVGLQPIIKSKEKYTYMSGTHFNTPIGKMCGFYYVRNLQTQEMLKITIPAFVMELPYIMC
jgi:ApaG protein